MAFTRSKATAARALAALPQTVEQKHETINRLLAAKEVQAFPKKSRNISSTSFHGSVAYAQTHSLFLHTKATGLTFDEIAKKLSLTNIYATNLFYLQAQLKPETAKKLSKIVPGISEQDIKHMQVRTYKEP